MKDDTLSLGMDDIESDGKIGDIQTGPNPA